MWYWVKENFVNVTFICSQVGYGTRYRNLWKNLFLISVDMCADSCRPWLKTRWKRCWTRTACCVPPPPLLKPPPPPILRYRPARLDCMRVVPLDRPLKGRQPLYVFDFLISMLNILNNFQVLSRFMQKGLLILLLVWITVCMCSNRDLFRRTVLQKFGRDINCSLDFGLRVKNFNIPQSKPK